MNKRAVWASTSARGGMSTFVSTLKDTSLWHDWNIRLVSTHSNGSVSTRLRIFATALCQFVVELTARRPDVVHLHSAAYGSFFRKAALAWISKAFGVPVVFHMHGADFHIFFEGAPRPLRWFIRTTLERMDALVSLGDAWAGRLREIAPKSRIVVVPNAIKPGVAIDQNIEGSVQVTFLGEVGDRKGTFTLIEAWALLNANRLSSPTARLSIAGDGDVERACKYVAELGIGDSVEVLGWISGSEVSQLLSRTQVLVLPSRDEGQPMAILEAMARGVCVIAGNVGGIPELLSDECGLLVEPDNAAQLAEAIANVVGTPAARTLLGTNAHRRIEAQFDVDVVSRRFDDLYRQVAK